MYPFLILLRVLNGAAAVETQVAKHEPRGLETDQHASTEGLLRS